MKKFTLIFTLVFIFSCSKKKVENINPFQGKYTTESEIAVTEPVMYTKGSIIKDSNIIKRFIANFSSWDLFYKNEFTFGVKTEPAPYSVIIDFVSSTEATLHYSNNPAKYYGFRVDKNNAIINWKDTFLYSKIMPDMGCNDFSENLYLYKPNYHECMPISTSTGDRYICRAIPIEKVISYDDDLHIKLFTELYSKTPLSGGHCGSHGKDVPNLLNFNLLSSLEDTDTIVVQQKRWTLKKL